jgi:hypothetical protein
MSLGNTNVAVRKELKQATAGLNCAVQCIDSKYVRRKSYGG